MRAALCLMAGLMLAGAAPPGPSVQPLAIRLDGLRSVKGSIMICVSRVPAHFPDCSKDPERRHLVVAATTGAISLGRIDPGDYAIAIIYDENGNGKLDTFAGIPREGVGFSRNPALRFGPPSFRSAAFPVAAAPVEQVIRLKYFL